MKSIAFVLALAVLTSGCSKTAQVGLTTDGQGKLASASIVRSSGDPSFDTRAIFYARKRFAHAVPHPAANRTYFQPVVFHDKPCGNCSN